MQYPRPLTRIHQIEPTSRCNLRCKYCPHPKMKRPKEDMTLETFERILEWVVYFDTLGTQPEISLTGLGEPLMHPHLPDMLRKLREVFDKRVLFSTNGVNIHKPEGLKLCRQIAQYDVELYISSHRPEIAQPAAINAHRAGMKKVAINNQFVTHSLDWAGQVDWEVLAKPGPCKYLRDGWGTVLYDGRFTTCCMDAEGDGIVGHVDDPLGSVGVSPYKLCPACSLVPPTGDQWNS